MSTAEILVRLFLAAVFIAAGTGLVLSVVAERYVPLAAALVLVAGTTTVAVRVAWPRGGEDRG